MSVEDLPEIVRNRALDNGATDCLEALPSLVADLERDWSISVGRTLTGGTGAYVAEAELEDGTDAVLKLSVPSSGDNGCNEVTILRLADGNSCVRLLRADVERDALLLERLGPSMFELRLPIVQRHEILCAAAERGVHICQKIASYIRLACARKSAIEEQLTILYQTHGKGHRIANGMA